MSVGLPADQKHCPTSNSEHCYHAVRHYIHDGKIEVDYIPSNYQPADLFTKALGPSKHHQFCLMVGLRNSYHLTMSNMYWIAMAMTKRGTRRFFSEYAAMQRVSHHRIITVSIQDFSYLDT